MSIKFNANVSVNLDLLTVISNKVNGIESTGRLADDVNSMWENFDLNVSGVAIFFQNYKDSPCYVIEKFGRRPHEFADNNELISAIFEGAVKVLQVSVLEYYDTNGKLQESYENIVNGKADSYKAINSLELSAKQKWELTGLILNPDEILTPLKEFCHRVKRKLKNIYKKYFDEMKDFRKHMTLKLKGDSDLLYKELEYLFSGSGFTKESDIEVSYSLMNENLTSKYEAGGTTHIIFGIKYDTTISKYMDDNSKAINDAFLKVFSDKHRMGIFRLLLNNEYYVGQIAVKENLVLSTASYHLDRMLSVGILVGRSQGKMVYYKVDRRYVLDQFDKIADMVDNGEY